MPENTRRAHIIGFPGDHSHFIQGYVYACEAEGKTPATVTSYRENLSRFQKAVSELSLPRQPSLLTRDHIRHYMAHLRASGSSASTANDRLAVLRLWLRWLREEGVIESDPTEGVKKLREERKVMETITPTQVEDHLLRLCSQLGRESAPAKRKAERDRAIILLLYNTGLRASELVGLDFADVDFDRMVVLVRHGKGRKQRVVSLGRVARQAHWRYVTHVRGTAPGPLLQSEQGGGRLLRSSLTQLLTKLAKRTGWPSKRCSPHMFRRGFAVEFLRAGGDPFRLQLIMGHEKLDMTRIYSQALSQKTR